VVRRNVLEIDTRKALLHIQSRALAVEVHTRRKALAVEVRIRSKALAVGIQIGEVH